MFVAEIQIAEGKGEIMNKKNEEDCSSELFIKAFNEINKLEKWDSRPEKKKDFSILFYPIDYFGNFKEGYTPEGLKKEAQFPGGIDAFKSELNSNVKKQKIKSTGKSAVIHFKINTEGDISQIIIESSDLNLEEKEKIIKAVEKTDKKWIPGTFRNTPVIFSHRLSLML
ncbi:MAG: hypothetical protein LBE92_15375 [Chryseobacterium sp.]|uniref:energy transducer TonB n=1 Tax=Chryseobacterium sp. TaxID=1871047 RepID=UPI00281E072A|nr:hypothetical protein [Chryseobacterium sp.]MDR2237500.1 hypothetical protein [Chryseobacterium sp.]